MDFYSEVARLFTHDPGQRGLAGRAPCPDLAALASSLMEAGSVLVVTGFPIPACNAGETDGPPGAVCVARALRAIGKTVAVVTDDYNLPLVRAAVRQFAPRVPVSSVPMEGADLFCEGLIGQYSPTHVIALERPGRAADGRYHNMHGYPIDAYVAATDALFAPDVITVGIGDGGNELGMGNIAPIVRQIVPNGGVIAAAVGSRYPLVAGVSNWWGWGIAALLSVAARQNLLPTDAEEEALLQAVVEAGAVDGMLKKQTMSVDGILFGDNLYLLRELRTLVEGALHP